MFSSQALEGRSTGRWLQWRKQSCPTGGNPPKILRDSSLPLSLASSRSSCCSVQVYWPEITQVTSILIEDSLCAILAALTNEPPPTAPRRLVVQGVQDIASTFLPSLLPLKSIPPLFLPGICPCGDGRVTNGRELEEFIARDNVSEFGSGGTGSRMVSTVFIERKRNRKRSRSDYSNGLQRKRTGRICNIYIWSRGTPNEIRRWVWTNYFHSWRN